MSITNQRISRFAETIFANDEHVQRPLPMAGRAEALDTFLNVFRRSDGPQVVTISAALGTGKTFFLNHAIARLVNEVGFPENVNRITSFGSHGPHWKVPDTAERLSQRFAAAKSSHRHVLLVEELDRKGRFPNLIWSVNQALAWLQRTSDALLVMTGDRFLEHPEVQERLSVVGVPVERIELEPLTRTLMAEALALRLQLVLQDGETQQDAVSAADRILDEPTVETAVLPPTSPATANFREAFGLLMEMSPDIDRVYEGVSFPSTLLRDHVAQPRLRPAQRLVDETVLAHIMADLESGNLVRPLTLNELQAEVSDTSSPDHFKKNVIYSLVATQVLDPQGIPYLSNGYTREDEPYAGPFLPRQNTFLRALSRIGGRGVAQGRG